jgi:hypothetical protein
MKRIDMKIEMYPYQIEIEVGKNNEDYHLEIYRINRIVGYAQALADLDNNEEYCGKISSIFEYKGNLTISWKTEPSENEKDYFQKAWESVVSGYEGNKIEHEILA